MSNNKRTLKELIADVTNELIRLNYSDVSIRISYIIPWNRFLKYADELGEEYFTEKLGERYLSENYGYPQDYDGKPTKPLKVNIRCIRILGDFQSHGVILRSLKQKNYTYPDNYIEFKNNIIKYAVDYGYSESSIRKIKHTLSVFLWYLHGNRVNRFSDVTPSLISGFIASQSGYSNATVSRNICTLRVITNYLYQAKYTKENLTEHIPKIKRIRNHDITTIWKKDEIDKLLNSVDRGNPSGKRNYAILLIAARLGLRESDIINLKLDDIDWKDCAIRIVQKKTGKLVELPLLEEIGLALIDYYKHGRPKTECTNIFVKHLAPYNEFRCLSHIIKVQLIAAGINIPVKAHGLHSLRHTLASRLLEENVPTLTISNVLGHASLYSTKDYLHIDMKNLVKCALNPDEVASYE
jgi:site-specific recombinase XerD